MWLALLGHVGRRHGGALTALAGGLFLFQWLITRVAPGLEAAGDPSAFIPPAFRAILADALANFSAVGMIGFSYAHPFAVVLMSAWAVRVPCGALAGEIGTGTMDLIAARPLPRVAVAGTALAALLLGLAAIGAAGWAGTCVGLWTQPIEGIVATRFLRIAAMQWLLFAAFGSVALLLSSFARAGGAAMAGATALIAGSFALDYVARAWEPIRFLRPLSLFARFSPQQITAAGLAWTDAAVLLSVCVVAGGAALSVFSRRDL